MYRQYEDPRKLEDELEKVKNEYELAYAEGNLSEDDIIYYQERIEELKERINFAWQDEEYDESMRDPADEAWLEENSRAYGDDMYGSEKIDDKQPVAAGIIKGLLSKASKFFDKFLNGLDRFMDSEEADAKLGGIGNRSGKEYLFKLLSDEFQKNGGEQKDVDTSNPKSWPMGSTLLVKVKFTNGENGAYDVFDVYMKRSDDADADGIVEKNLQIDYTDPADKKQSWEELNNAVFQTVDKYWNEFFPNSDKCLQMIEVTASSKIRVTLKKVMAADEMDIELVAIDTPYSPADTNDILNRITESPDFIESLPMNEPASYDVNPDDLSVLECDSCNPDQSECIFSILKALYTLYFDSMYVVWNAKGSNYTSIVSCADSYVWNAKGLIDQLSEYHYQMFNYAPHPATFVNACDASACMETPNEIVLLQSDLQSVVDWIDLCYCNFDGTIQASLLQTKDLFEKEIGYTLARFAE